MWAKVAGCLALYAALAASACGGVVDGRDAPRDHAGGSSNTSGSGGAPVDGRGGGPISETGGSREPESDAGNVGRGTGGTAGGTQEDGGLVGGGMDELEPPVTCKRSVQAASSGDLSTAVSGATAGDCIELADGAYSFPTIKAMGNAAAPIVIRAANTLKATTTGRIVLDGAAYVIVQGVSMSGGGTVELNDCDHCRFSRARIQHSGGGEWIHVDGVSKYCRIDHNDMGPQGSGGNMIQLGGAQVNGKAQVVQYTRIDHNYFHDVHYGGGNGWECIRAGLSGYSMSSAFSVIEQNLFVHANNDPETVSIKSSDTILRYNTMRATSGQFSLRHGNRNVVYGNYVFGDGVGGAQGIRVCGGDHKIYNNYVEGTSIGITLEGGEHNDTSGQLTDHKQVYRTTVAFNTLVDTDGIELGGSHALEPIDCTVAYNIVQGGSIRQGNNTKNTTYLANIGSGSVANLMNVDAKLVKMGDVFKLGAGSPAIDAATQPFPFATEDQDGQPRQKPDIGADEISSAPVKVGPLRESDVGPLAP
jgi:hypothetical protein